LTDVIILPEEIKAFKLKVSVLFLTLSFSSEIKAVIYLQRVMMSLKNVVIYPQSVMLSIQSSTTTCCRFIMAFWRTFFELVESGVAAPLQTIVVVWRT
jgi:hypothetical protein